MLHAAENGAPRQSRFQACRVAGFRHENYCRYRGYERGNLVLVAFVAKPSLILQSGNFLANAADGGDSLRIVHIFGERFRLRHT